MLVAGLSLSLFAGSFSSMPPSIKTAEQNGIKVIEQFKAENGLDAWLVKNRSGYNVWYSDDKGYVHVGALLDPNGNNLTARYLDEKAPKPNYMSLLDDLTVVSTQPDNPSKRPVFVFYEPHCGFCSAFHAAAKPYVDAGAEVRWVPVAFLRSPDGMPTSHELIAKIMGSDNPNEVIEQHEYEKALSAGQRGLAQGSKPDSSTYAVTEKNSEIMNELGFSGTPAIAFVDGSGNVQLIKGFPEMSQLPNIFGMERMDSADRRLSRFKAQPTQYPVKAK